MTDSLTGIGLVSTVHSHSLLYCNNANNNKTNKTSGKKSSTKSRLTRSLNTPHSHHILDLDLPKYRSRFIQKIEKISESVDLD